MRILSIVFLLIYFERSIGHHHHHHYRSHYSDGPFEYEPVYGRSVVENTAKCVGEVTWSLAQCSVMEVPKDKIRQLCAEVTEGSYRASANEGESSWLLPNPNLLSCIGNVAWGVTKKILIKLILGSGEGYRSSAGAGDGLGNLVIPGAWPIFECIAKIKWMIFKGLIEGLPLNKVKQVCASVKPPVESRFEGSYRTSAGDDGAGDGLGNLVIPGAWNIFECIANIKWMIFKGLIEGLPLNKVKQVCASVKPPVEGRFEGSYRTSAGDDGAGDGLGNLVIPGAWNIFECIANIKWMIFKGLIEGLPLNKVKQVCASVKPAVDGRFLLGSGDDYQSFYGDDEDGGFEYGNYRTGLAIPGVWQIFTCIAKIKWMIFKGFIEGLPLNKVKRVCASTDSQKYIGLSDVARCIKQMKMMVLEGLITLTIPIIKIKKICKAQNGNDEGGEEESGGPEANYRRMDLWGNSNYYWQRRDRKRQPYPGDPGGHIFNRIG